MFSNFKALAKELTSAYYRAALGEQFSEENLIVTERIVEEQQEQRKNAEVMLRYYQGIIGLSTPAHLPVKQFAAPQSAGLAGEELQKSRELIERSLPVIADSVQARSNSFDRKETAQKAQALMKVGVKKANAEQFGLNNWSEAAAQSGINEAQGVYNAAINELAPYAKAIRTRLLSGLQLLFVPKVEQKIAKAPVLREETQHLLQAHAKLDSVHSTILNLMKEHNVCQLLAENFEEDESKLSKNIYQQLEQRLQKCFKLMSGLKESLKEHLYPFEHAGEAMTLAGYLSGELLEGGGLGGIMENAGEVLNKYFSVYFRILGRLAAIGEEVEGLFGLKPLPKPLTEEDAQNQQQNAGDC